jgi:hypothetical protein
MVEWNAVNGRLDGVMWMSSSLCAFKKIVSAVNKPPEILLLNLIREVSVCTNIHTQEMNTI